MLLTFLSHFNIDVFIFFAFNTVFLATSLLSLNNFILVACKLLSCLLLVVIVASPYAKLAVVMLCAKLCSKKCSNLMLELDTLVYSAFNSSERLVFLCDDTTSTFSGSCSYNFMCLVSELSIFISIFLT